jgi:flavodoxin
MRIGIFVYSQSGNTLSVAEKLSEKLAGSGHAATVEKIITVGEVSKDFTNIRFEKMPAVGKYDGLVLAAPVQGFSLNPVMSAWLAQLPSLSGKKVACFVTKKFGNDWTGGSKAVALITAAVQEKGGAVAGSGIVHWGTKKDEEAAALAAKLSALF